MAAKLSCVLITFNEEDVLGETLRRLQWCDEIVVVDSGSNDKTVSIAKDFGAKVFTRKFDGYGPQKNYAVVQATNDWILSVDADELLTPELVVEIQSKMQQINLQKSNNKLDNDLNSVAYKIPIILYFLKKKITFWFGATQSPIRLFNRTKGQFDSATLHEQVVFNGTVENLKHSIDHLSYRGVHHYFEKFNSYTTKAAESYFKAGKRAPCLFELMLRFHLKFIGLYFLRGGFRLGLPGFAWCIFSALYPVVKYIKLREKYDQAASAKNKITV